MSPAVAISFIVIWGLAVVASAAFTARAALVTRGRDDSGLLTSVWVSAGATLPGTAAFAELLIHLVWRLPSHGAPPTLIPLFLWWFVGPVLVASSRSMPMKVAVPTAVHQARRSNVVAWALSSVWVLFLVTALD
jgi:hypothetical protein